ALGFYFADKVNRYGLDMVGWIVGVTTPAITVRRVWRDLRAGKAGTFWNRLMEGRLGRGLFAIAGRTVRDAPMIPSAEPTAVVLARATEDLYHALPAEHRRRLGDMPKVIAGLEADAAVLRQLDGADPARAARLETAVAALENLRLDLLRLHAGQRSIDELTADIGRVHEIARRVDAMADT
ncbi:MAG TPA: hypothetical protein VIJ16_08620, partial [Gemmatimonadaceae bacterium]